MALEFITFLSINFSILSPQFEVEVGIIRHIDLLCQGNIGVNRVAKHCQVRLVQMSQLIYDIHRNLTEIGCSKLRGVAAAVVGHQGRKVDAS